MKNIEAFPTKKTEKITSYLVLGSLLLGLFLFGYLGIHNRYWADDWCYNADFKNLGLVETLNGYNHITTYASNRFSLTLFSGLLYYLGIFGVKIMSPINLFLWFFGIFWILRSLRKIFHLPVGNFGILSIVLVSQYFSLYTAPHLFQSVYWRSGTLPYGEPIVIGVIVFGILFHQAARETISVPLIVLAMILTFLAGGFSEAASATLVTSAFIYLILAIIFRKQQWARKSLPMAIGILLASILSMTVLIISPTNGQRLDKYGEQANIIELIITTFKFSYDFVKFSFFDAPIPHLAIMISSGLFGYAYTKSSSEAPKTMRIFALILFAILISYLLIAASYAPSALIERTPPAPRTRIIPRFILTMVLVAISYGLGYLLKHKAIFRWMPVFAPIFFFMMFMYSSYTIKNIYSLDSVYSERAKLWDARSVKIDQAVLQGEDTVVVYGIDGLPVGGIRDFVSGGEGIWINNCAASYYGLEQIIVNDP